MIEKLAKQTYSNLLNMPPAERDLKEFAEKVLNEFIKELEANQMTVRWNYNLDSVVFLDKNVDGKLSLQDIKEKFLGSEDKTSNSTLE